MNKKKVASQKSNTSKQTTEANALSAIEDQIITDPVDSSTSNKAAQKKNDLEDKICTPCEEENCIEPIIEPQAKKLEIVASDTKSDEKLENKIIPNSSTPNKTLENSTCTPSGKRNYIEPIIDPHTKDLAIIPPATKHTREKFENNNSTSDKKAGKNNTCIPCEIENCTKPYSKDSPENKIIREPLGKSVVVIAPQEKSQLSDDTLKDYSIIDPEAKTDEKESSNELGEKSGKGGKNYYYTQPETSLLKDIKKLFKLKRKHKACLKCKKEIEKIPEHDCRIKVEAWEKHDKEKCEAEDKDYTLVGELLFPVCSKDLFYKSPGVPIRNSQKSYTLNDPDKFGKPELEKRQYAYPEKIIPACLLDWTEDDQKELEHWIVLHPGTSKQVGNCYICKEQ